MELYVPTVRRCFPTLSFRMAACIYLMCPLPSCSILEDKRKEGVLLVRYFLIIL